MNFHTDNRPDYAKQLEELLYGIDTGSQLYLIEEINELRVKNPSN